MPGGFDYRITEEGDLLLFGVQGDLGDPAEAPYFAERERILRVITARGATIGARALEGYPNLRVAILSGARAVGERAFAGCPRLAAVLTDPTTHGIAASAFVSCPSLTMLDYAGPPAAALSLLPPSLTASGELCLRTVPSAEGDVIAEGALAGGAWRLTADGTLTVSGDAIPDYPSHRETPWYPHRASIRRAVTQEGVRRVGSYAFALLPNLQSATVTAAKEIAPFAFAHAAALTRADIFPTVTAVGHYAFAGCGLNTAFPGASARTLGRGLFDECAALCTLLLPFLPFTAERDTVGKAPALRSTLLFGSHEEMRALRGFPHLRLLTERQPSRRILRECERADAARDRVALALHTLEDAYREADGHRATLLLRLGNALHNEAGEAERRRELAAAVKDARRLVRAIERTSDRTARLARECDRARATLAAARTAAAALYPFDGAYTEGILDTAAYIEGISVPSATTLKAAAARAERLPGEITGGLAGDAMRAVADMATLLAPDTEDGTRAAPPSVLILGGDPREDAAIAATARAVRRAGGIPVINPTAPQDTSYDALILCDGGRVAPYLYTSARHGLTEEGDRNAIAATYFDAFLLYGKPILGIGRGCELENALLGGTVSEGMHPTALARHSGGVVHPVLCDGGFLREIYGEGRLSCISAHEEGVGTVGREMSVVARAEDGTPEAIEHRRLPIYGVMFAPERMLDPAAHPEAISDGGRLFAWFVTEARKSRRARAGRA